MILWSIAYVVMVATANLLIVSFGAAAVPIVSFFLIGGLIVVRDRLHDVWVGNVLVLRMGVLIALGGAVSYAVNIEALPIAIASVVAFVASETTNALVYEPLRSRGVPWLRRVNLGNIANAVVDSVLFVTIAFGFAPGIVVLQVAAKVLGGLVWSSLPLWGSSSIRMREAAQ